MNRPNQPEPPTGDALRPLIRRVKGSLESVPVGPTLVVAAVILLFLAAVALVGNRLEEFAEREFGQYLVHARHFEKIEADAATLDGCAPAPAERPGGGGPAGAAGNAGSSAAGAAVADPIRQRLCAHLADIRGFAHYHARAARAFFVHQYKAVTIATYAAVLAGLLLVPISWTGWKDAKLVLTLPFFLAAGTAIMFGAFTQIYKSQDNIDTNTALYFGYLALEDEILSYYPRRQAAREAGEELESPPRAFLVEIEKRLKTMRTLGVALDASSVPQFKEVFEAVSQAQQGAGGG